MLTRTILGLVASLTVSAGLQAQEIDFEGVAPGTRLSEVSSGAGISGPLPGFVGVYAFNPDFGLGTNAAVVFDSANPTGGDDDLGTPNEDFGGPGHGTAGETTNDVALGNLLIVAKDFVDEAPADGLVDDPDDADEEGAYFEFDFSTASNHKKKSGTVTINSVTLVDIEGDEGGTFLELSGPGLPVNLIAIPTTGDNGKITIEGIGLSGVDLMRVNMDGSGAIAAVAANQDVGSDCWFTTGGFLNAGVSSGPKDYTFGGNVGPPSSGALEVVDHDTGDNFHTNNVYIVSCQTVDATGPGQPGGKKGFVINEATFEGTGRLNGVDGYPFVGVVIDAGEPGGKKNNDHDFFEIVVRDPGTSAVVFLASGDLDGGNVQLHPPVGN